MKTRIALSAMALTIVSLLFYSCEKDRFFDIEAPDVEFFAGETESPFESSFDIGLALATNCDTIVALPDTITWKHPQNGKCYQIWCAPPSGCSGCTLYWKDLNCDGRLNPKYELQCRCDDALEVTCNLKWKEVECYEDDFFAIWSRVTDYEVPQDKLPYFKEMVVDFPSLSISNGVLKSDPGHSLFENNGHILTMMGNQEHQFVLHAAFTAIPELATSLTGVWFLEPACVCDTNNEPYTACALQYNSNNEPYRCLRPPYFDGCDPDYGNSKCKVGYKMRDIFHTVVLVP